MRKWIIAGVVLAVAAGIAWFVVGFLSRPSADDLPGGPGRPGVARKAETRRPPPRAARPVETTAPSGGILVLDVDGAPAWTAGVLTSADEVALATPGAWRELARVEMGRAVESAAFRTAPLAFVRAVGRGSRSPVVPWDARGVVLRLDEGCVVEGRVVDEGRQPVAGAFVRARPGPRTSTDEDGRFRLAGFDEGVEVTVLAGAAPGTHAETKLTFAAGERRREIEFVLAGVPPGALVADIRFAARPLAEPTLEIVPADAKERREDRAFATELPLQQRTLLRIAHAEELRGLSLRLRVTCIGFRTTDVTARIPEDRVETLRIDVPEGGLAPTGVVLDADGKPVAGAEIHADRTRGGVSSYVSALSAADGTFAVPSGAGLWVAAILRGKGASDWVQTDDAEGELVLRLGAGGIVEGTVRAEGTHAVVAGATVRLLVGELHREARWTAVADDAGHYVFPAVPLGADLRAEVADAGRWSGIAAEGDPDRFDETRREARASGVVRTLATPGETWTRDLTATEWKGVDARFELRFPPGVTAPAELTVEAKWTHAHGWVTTTWDAAIDPASPSFDRYLRAGHHRVQVRAAGVDAATIEFDVEGDGPGRTIVIDLKAAPKGRIRARLLGADGKPQQRAGRTVTVRGDRAGNSRGSSEVPVGNDGTADLSDAIATIPVEPDQDVVLFVNGPGLFEHDRFTAFPELRMPLATLLERRAARTDEDLVLDLRPAAFVEIDVHVKAGDAPVVGVVLETKPAKSFEDRTTTSDARGVATVRLTSEKDQHHNDLGVRALPPYEGTWELAGSGFEETTAGVARVGERWVAELRVKGGREVRVVLVDPEGRPVAGAREDQRGRGDRAAIVTDSDGRFTTFVAGAEQRFSVAFTGYIVQPVEIAADATEVRLVAMRKRSVRVAVRDVPPGAGQIHVVLALTGGTWTSGRNAEGDGAERTTPAIQAPELPLDVTARSKDHRWRATGRVAADEDRIELTLSRAPDAAFEVRVAYPDGTPVAGRDVRVGADVLSPPVRTDEDGVARFSIPEGAYPGCIVSVPHYACEPSQVDLVLPRAEPLRLVARFRAYVEVRRRTSKPGSDKFGAATLILADGARLPAQVLGTESGQRELLSLGLDRRAPGTLEVEYGRKTFTFPFDPAKPGSQLIELE